MQGNTKKVLIAEDDKTVRELLYDFLKLSGFKTYCADNGISALKLARKMHFDIIISDYYMPGMDGIELVKNIRTYFPDTLIIGISGNCSKGDFLRAGASAFLPKPFRLQELISLFEKI
ncbi:MAG: response regulator [Nitrospirae bacterium]|nr:response regulator [Nitrospirota bacterium]MCL5238273.1 response regulator [Nitrospirota bacterium]